MSASARIGKKPRANANDATPPTPKEDGLKRLRGTDWAGLLIAVGLLAVAIWALTNGFGGDRGYRRLRHYGGAVGLAAFALWWGWSLLRDDGEVTRIDPR